LSARLRSEHPHERLLADRGQLLREREEPGHLARQHGDRLRGNNIQSPADFGTYGITWSASSSSPSRDATDWVSTAAFPISIPYTYAVQDPACVKQKLPAVAGAGKTLATLSCN